MKTNRKQIALNLACNLGFLALIPCFIEIPAKVYQLSFIGIIIIGAILGFAKKVTIYRDFLDLTKVFLLVLVPMLFMRFLHDTTIKYIFWGIEAILLIWIFIGTLKDNGNIFKAIIAFITKVPLGVIFALYIVNLIFPGGDTRKERRESSAISGLILLLLTPILYGLVKFKTWNSNKNSSNE